MTTQHKRSFLKLPVTSRCPVSTHSFPSQPRNQWRCCPYLEIEFPDYFLHINRRPTKSFCWHSKSCLLSCACNILYVCSCGMDENQFTGIYVQGHILMLYLVGSCHVCVYMHGSGAVVFWSGVFYGWPNKVQMTTTLLMFLLLFVVRGLTEGQVKVDRGVCCRWWSYGQHATDWTDWDEHGSDLW